MIRLAPVRQGKTDCTFEALGIGQVEQICDVERCSGENCRRHINQKKKKKIKWVKKT